MKICNHCGIELTKRNWYKSYQKNHIYTCKDCRKEYHKNYLKKYYHNNKEKFNKDARKYHLLQKFNLTLEQYDEMFEIQNGICAICGKPEIHKYKDTIKRLSVDHDHKTGKIRGLLCYRCNSILGFADDNVYLLKKLIKYLEA